MISFSAAFDARGGAGIDAAELRQVGVPFFRAGRALSPCLSFQADAQSLRRLNGEGYTVRVMRYIQLLSGVTYGCFLQSLKLEIELVDWLLRQKSKGKGKLYAIHEVVVDCIS